MAIWKITKPLETPKQILKKRSKPQPDTNTGKGNDESVENTMETESKCPNQTIHPRHNHRRNGRAKNKSYTDASEVQGILEKPGQVE